MKKFMPVLLSVALVLCSFGAAFGAEGAAKTALPSDIAGSSCEKAVTNLLSLGVVSGYPDGTYQPKKAVTRAEMAKLIITALDMDDSAIDLYAGSWSDVSAKSWAKGYIGYSQHLGIIQGNADGTFRPNDTVTYDEASAMLVRALGYTDKSLTGSWPANYRNQAAALGIAKEGAAGKSGVNRGDIAIMLDAATAKPIGTVTDDGKWTASEKDTMKARLTASAEQPQQGKIPYGERLINEYGLGGAVEDSTADILNSTYYEIPDFYSLGSSDTLTMLTNFKTTQQMTGWTCGPTSALMTLEWYGKRGDLNELDLASLRGKEPGGATTLKGMITIFDGLEKKLGQKWDVVSSYDLKEDKDGVSSLGMVLEVEKGKILPLEEAIPYYVEQGEPVIVGSQAWDGHYQVIIGYDTMGTDTTQDDVLVLADPYDTTDHMQDGYVVQSYERFIYDWSAAFDPDFETCIFLAAVPDGYKYSGPAKGKTLEKDAANRGRFTDIQAIPYTEQLKVKLAALSKTYAFPIDIGKNGLSGPADSAYYRQGDNDQSPYYKLVDGYNLKNSKSLTMLEQFKTTQQITEYNCGVTSMLMTLEWFGKRGNLDEMDLTGMRDKKDELPGTTVKEMLNIIGNLDSKWDVKSSADIVKGDSDLEFGIMIDGKYKDLAEIIPYYLEKKIPVMVMWHEWGGHWQVIIGYDNMGTEATQDDVLILADPYDTTDHNQDGYLIQSYERFIYDWGNTYDKDAPWGGFVVMNPAKSS